MGDVELLLGPGDGHIGEAALLLQLRSVVKDARRREDAVLHPRQENDRELEPFGAVHGHQNDGVVGVVHAVKVGVEGDLLEEAGEVPLGVLLLVLDQGGFKLADVLEAVFALLALGAQHGAVAGPVEQVFQQDVERLGERFVPQLLNHPGKVHQHPRLAGEDGVGAGVFEHLKDALPALGRDFLGGEHGRLADGALGLVDDAAQPDDVARVVDDAQIGDEVLDLLALEELGAAEQPVRDARLDEILLNDAGLGVHPVEDGVVAVAHSLGDVLLDGVGDEFRLGVLVGELAQLDLLPRAVLGPEVFALAGHVVADDLVGGVEDVLGGAVVLLEPDDGRAGELLLKAQDVLDGRAAELIDALVVVADDAEVFVGARQQAHELKLGVVGVLVLVDEDVAPAVLVVLEDIGVLHEELDRLADDIVEIEGVCL